MQAQSQDRTSTHAQSNEESPRTTGRRQIDFAGRFTPANKLIPRITLPTNYEFGDNYQSQDLRLSRTFVFREIYKLTLIGEVFNILNIANLTGYSGNLANTATSTHSKMIALLWQKVAQSARTSS